jgi:hypothetical protein
MRVLAFAATVLLLGACASGPEKPPMVDGTNLRPINSGYPGTYAEYPAQRKLAAQAQQPRGAASVTSAALKLSVLAEKDAVVLMFVEPPASLFIRDRKTGANVTDVEWVSDTTIRLALADMRELEIKTAGGTLAVKVEGGQLYPIQESAS